MINKWNSFKEKFVISAANLLPRPVAYWAFIRVATFECPGNPVSQTCAEALKRFHDPEKARAELKQRLFGGPAFKADASELIDHQCSTIESPIHECLGLWWFWDETWTDRIGPYETNEQARRAAVAYGEWVQDGKSDDASVSIDLAPLQETDPRHPLNNEFARTTDGEAWAKAFVNTITMLGQDLALDQKFMNTWFANAIMRGYDQGYRATELSGVAGITINALDAKSIAEHADVIYDALRERVITQRERREALDAEGAAVIERLRAARDNDPQATINEDPSI